MNRDVVSDWVCTHGFVEIAPDRWRASWNGADFDIVFMKHKVKMVILREDQQLRSFGPVSFNRLTVSDDGMLEGLGLSVTMLTALGQDGPAAEAPPWFTPAYIERAREAGFAIVDPAANVRHP